MGQLGLCARLALLIFLRVVATRVALDGVVICFVITRFMVVCFVTMHAVIMSIVRVRIGFGHANRGIWSVKSNSDTNAASYWSLPTHRGDETPTPECGDRGFIELGITWMFDVSLTDGAVGFDGHVQVNDRLDSNRVMGLWVFWIGRLEELRRHGR
jgi:hypothetical protein